MPGDFLFLGTRWLLLLLLLWWIGLWCRRHWWWFVVMYLVDTSSSSAAGGGLGGSGSGRMDEEIEDEDLLAGLMSSPHAGHILNSWLFQHMLVCQLFTWLLAYGLRDLTWLIRVVVCLLAADRGSSFSLTYSLDGCIVCCGIISSCQSAATSETVKCFWSWVLTHIGSVVASTQTSLSYFFTFNCRAFVRHTVRYINVQKAYLVPYIILKVLFLSVLYEFTYGATGCLHVSRPVCQRLHVCLSVYACSIRIPVKKRSEFLPRRPTWLSYKSATGDCFSILFW